MIVLATIVLSGACVEKRNVIHILRSSLLGLTTKRYLQGIKKHQMAQGEYPRSLRKAGYSLMVLLERLSA